MIYGGLWFRVFSFKDAVNGRHYWRGTKGTLVLCTHKQLANTMIVASLTGRRPIADFEILSVATSPDMIT